MRVSVELVPRNEAELQGQLEELMEFPLVDTVNIPDIIRFRRRSWECCRQAARQLPNTVPHLRAIDVDLARPLPVAPSLRDGSIKEVLVVAGDAPADMSRPVFETTSLDLIRKIRREHPEVSVYAAFDPYRQSFQAERAYAVRKLEAGAKGLFTQPFFDLRLMQVFAELLADFEVFWGVTSVTSRRSQLYWRNRNKAIFPASFEPTLEWNQRFARDALSLVGGLDDNIYFMPIRTGVKEYLEGVL